MRASLFAITSRDGRRVAVDTRSAIPIYRQLSDQIRLLVELGELAPGSRLPSASQLADNLDVHRNTVQKAYLTLRRSGVIVSDGSRGTFVSPAKPSPRAASERLLQLLGQLVREAETTALTPGELASLVQLHASAREALHNRSIVFVECNPASLGHYKGEIERTLGIRVEPVLLDNVATLGTLDVSSHLVVTTFFHYADLRRRLHAAGLGNELVAISVRAHIEVLQQLNDLRPGTRLGVVYLADDPNASARLSRMYDAVTHTHLSGVSVTQVAVKADATESDFVGLDAVLVRPENISQVRPFIPRDVRVIEFKNTLDEASLQLLRETLTDHRDAELER
jgi:DNA-binding transcriptional regulator YhcF (GntR family)